MSIPRKLQERIDKHSEKYLDYDSSLGYVAARDVGYRISKELYADLEMAMEALENIKNHDACRALTQGRHEKFNSFEDAWLGVAEYAGQALTTLRAKYNDQEGE